MISDIMPERIHAYWKMGVYPYWDNEQRDEYGSVEYIRVNVVNDVLDELNTRQLAVLEMLQRLSAELESRLQASEAGNE